MKPSDDPATRNLYLQTARDQLTEQFQRSRGMEFRAATVATVACALAGVAAVLLKDFSIAEPHGLSIAVTVLAAIIKAAYIGTLSFSSPGRVDGCKNGCSSTGPCQSGG